MAITLTPSRPNWFRYGLLVAPTVVLGFLWIAGGRFVPPALLTRSAQFQGIVTTFLGIFIEALPFLLAGVIASVVIQQWITPAILARFIPRHVVGATLFGSLLGLIFPVCECGAIPASRRLLRKGAAPGVGMAFALAAPVVNPIVIISTTVAFNDWRWAAGRVGLTIVIAMAVSLILTVGFQRRAVLAPAALVPDAAPDDHVHGPTCDHGHDSATLSGWRGMLAHGSLEFFEMSQYLVIGAVLAALMQTFFPQSLLLNITQGTGMGVLGPIVSIAVLMLVAVLLSVCSTVDAFLALAFVGLFHPGAIMAFLVFGPMIDIKSTLMLGSTFRKPTVAAMVVLAFTFTLIAGLAMYLLIK
jgi:uncharacterized membrane protein YraQ (UPF0718 family)